MREKVAPGALAEEQKWFAEIITKPFREEGEHRLHAYAKDKIAEIRERIAQGPFLKPEQCIGLYQQQYWWRLSKILQDHFPSVHSLLGSYAFDHWIAEPYLLQHPPCDWFLPNLGVLLPPFLEKQYWEEDRALILPLARIDLAYKQLFYAGTFVLFAFAADFFSFRDKLLDEEPEYWIEHDFPDLSTSEKNDYFVVYREEGEIHWEKIHFPQYILLKAFQDGANIPEAIQRLEDAGLGEEAMPHISDWFRVWGHRKWVSF